MSSWPLRIYDRLPWWSQNVICSAVGFKIQHQRYGRGYERVLSDTVRDKTLSGSSMESYLHNALVDHFEAALNSPFWYERFKKCDVKTPVTEPFKALQKLPILGKEEVRRRRTDIVSKSVDDRNIRSIQTGGTTGAGLSFIETKYSEWKRWAIWWRYRMEHGITPGTWSAHFSGHTVVGKHVDRPPFHRWNVPGRQIFFDPVALSRDHAPHYIKAIRRHELPWVHGYPSVISELAHYARQAKVERPTSVRWVTTGAENLTQKQREIIEEVFQAPVFEHYGLAESVANISQLPDGKYYVDEDFSFVEFVPLGKDYPGIYRIIGTSFSNAAFPLFRYDTGDLARLDEAPRYIPKSNWSRCVEGLDGRATDFIALPDGRRGGPFNHIFKKVETISAAQVYQPTLDSVRFRVVRGPSYQHPKDTKKLLDTARRRLGEDVEMDVEFVDELERRPNGKLPLVISEVD